MIIPRFGQGYTPTPIPDTLTTYRGDYYPNRDNNQNWYWTWYYGQYWFYYNDYIYLNGSRSRMTPTLEPSRFLGQENGLPPISATTYYFDATSNMPFQTNILAGWGCPNLFCMEVEADIDITMLYRRHHQSPMNSSFASKSFIKNGETYELKTWVCAFRDGGDNERKFCVTFVPRENSKNLASYTDKITSNAEGTSGSYPDYYINGSLGKAGCMYITWGLTDINVIQNAIIADLEYVTSMEQATVKRTPRPVYPTEKNLIVNATPYQNKVTGYPLNATTKRHVNLIIPLGWAVEKRPDIIRDRMLTGQVGYGTFQGITTENDIPIGYRKVRLYNADTGQLMATAFSDENGHYEFGNLNTLANYYVLSIDPNKVFNVVSETVPPLDLEQQP